MSNRCELCGELFDENSQRAEMYDPSEAEPDPVADNADFHGFEVKSVICHAECGLQKGLEVA